MKISPLHTKVIDRIQRHFPLVEHPFAAMADELSINEDDMMSVIDEFKKAGIIRGISGMFSAERLGFTSALVAFRISGDCGDAASIVNEHPGVGHNYERDHACNLWFTIVAESSRQLERDVAMLADMAGADDYLIFKSERVFKLRVHLPMGDADSDASGGRSPQDETRYPIRPLTDPERATVRLLQMDLPIEHAPFASIISRQGIDMGMDEFLEHARQLSREGILRRYSAVLHHRRAGYTANAMTAWRPGDGSDIEAVSRVFASRRSVSHLYLRTMYPGKWEYPLFAMFHAKTEDELTRDITECAAAAGINDYLVLRSMRQFKKERVIYDETLFATWRRRIAS